MFSSDTQINQSSLSQKSKKSTQDNSPFKTIGVQSENPLLKRPPFRSGRIQEEAQKFLSIPEEKPKKIKREDRSVPLASISSNSNLTSKSKGKAKKSSSSQHSSRSKGKSKAISNDTFEKNNSIFEPSKLLKQPVQSKKYNLDFDSRWEYFLELKTLDDATKRIYNSAFFQLWKTIYQKRYMQRAEEQASQINTTLDRFNSSHAYSNQNSFSNSYNSNRQNSNFDINSRISRRTELSNGYSLSSFQDSSEARVERMQQKYRKNYSNYNYSNNSSVNSNNYANMNKISRVDINYINKKSNIYGDRSFNSNMDEYYNKFNNNQKNSINTINNLNYNNVYNNSNSISERNYANYDSNRVHNNQSQQLSRSYNSEHLKKSSIEHSHDDGRFNFDYLSQKNLLLKNAASDPINQIENTALHKSDIKNDEIIRQSRSYGPSISKELIDEIEGRISDQNEKEIALDFASQLNTIAHFNSTLSGYNKHHKNSYIEEEEKNEESKNVELHNNHEEILNKNEQISTENEKVQHEQQEEDFNNLNDSNNFIESDPNLPTNENHIQHSTHKKAIFVDTVQKDTQNLNLNLIDKNYQNIQDSNYSNKQNNVSFNQEIQYENDFDSQFQKKKVQDRYDQYIEQITNPSKSQNNPLFTNDNEDDVVDLLNYFKAQRSSFQSASNNDKIRNSKSANQAFSRPQFSSNSNSSKSAVTLEKLLQLEEAKKNEIPVDTDLNNGSIRQANASRIQSVLSKTTIGYNNYVADSDSDSDQIDLSDVQFYHISQAANARFSNSNASGIRQSKSASISRNREIFDQYGIENDDDENDDSDLTPVPRNKRTKSDVNQDKLNESSKQSHKMQQKLSSRQSKQDNSIEDQENNDSLNEMNHKGQLSSARSSLRRSSSRRKRSATISGISPVFALNLNQNEQENESKDNKSRRKQQINQNDDERSNNQYQESKANEKYVNSRNKQQENQFDNSRNRQQDNQYDNSGNKHQDNQYVNSRNRQQENQFDNNKNKQQYNQFDNSRNRQQDNQYDNSRNKQQENQFDNSRNKQQDNQFDNNMNQQTKRINDRYQNDQVEIDTSKSKRNQQEDQSKNIIKQQAKQINNNNVSRYQDNEFDETNRNLQTNELESNVNEISNRKKYQNDQSNEFNKNSRNQRRSNRFESNKINSSSSLSVTNRKSYTTTEITEISKRSTTSELTEISKRNLISRNENYSDESYENNKHSRYKKKKRRRRSDDLYDDQEFYEEEEEDYDDEYTENNSNMRDENFRRAELSSLYDEEEFLKMEKNARFYSPLITTSFPDDLYDDIFATGSERRNEYLNKTKLAPIIEFFSMKEFGES